MSTLFDAIHRVMLVLRRRDRRFTESRGLPVMKLSELETLARLGWIHRTVLGGVPHFMPRLQGGSRDSDIQSFVFRHNSAGGDLDTDRKSFFSTRAILVTAVTFIGDNPSDTDGDTTAIDVSASTDGFSSDDNEIAVLAAQEFNDTDSHAQFGTLRDAKDIALTTASIAAGTAGVRVTAGSVVEVTGTNVGAGADTRYNVVIEYIVL